MRSKMRSVPVPRRFRTARIIALAFSGAVFIYGLLIYLISQQPLDRPMPPMDQKFRAALWVMAILCQPVTAVVASRMKIAPPKSEDPEGQVLAAQITTQMIVRLAAAESASIFGLLIFFITRDYKDFLLLATFTLALHASLFPTREAWERAGRDAGHDWKLD